MAANPNAVQLASLPNGIIFQTIAVESYGRPTNVLAPAPGMSVYVYAHGTTTPQVSVYQDEGLTQLMTQPIRTSPDGYVPGYVASGQALDLVVSNPGVANPVLFTANAVVGAGAIPLIQKDVASGVAGLDAGALLKVAELPPSVAKSTPGAYDQFAGKSGAFTGTLTDSGHTWSVLGGMQNLASLSGGQMVFNATPPSYPAAYYAELPMGAQIRRIGLKFRVGTPPTPNTEDAIFAMGHWDSASQVAINSTCHLVVAPTNWAYGIWIGNSYVVIASRYFDVPLALNTDYSMQVVTDAANGRAAVEEPDGRVQAVYDPRLRSLPVCFQAFWEPSISAAGDGLPGISEIWCDT